VLRALSRHGGGGRLSSAELSILGTTPRPIRINRPRRPPCGTGRRQRQRAPSACAVDPKKRLPRPAGRTRVRFRSSFPPRHGRLQPCSRDAFKGLPTEAPLGGTRRIWCIGVHARWRAPRRMKWQHHSALLPRRGPDRNPRDAHSVPRFWRGRGDFQSWQNVGVGACALPMGGSSSTVAVAMRQPRH
jgi:hypothetical protein